MTIDYLPQEMMVNTQEWIGSFGASDGETFVNASPIRRRSRVTKTHAIVEEKLRIPDMTAYLRRPRLTGLLERTKERAGVTLVCGRSGTGKTVAAADFSASYKSSSWYSIEPADTDWRTFSKYLLAALFSNSAVDAAGDEDDGRDVADGPAEIAEFLSRCMRRAEIEFGGGCRLLVLDNLHHLFDSDWFPDFFAHLIASRSGTIHVLMLCRSKPPLPLWRLRSKQMLNLIDEGVLGFTQSETLQLCDHLGLPPQAVAQAHLRSSGRVSKLIDALLEIGVTV